MSKVDVLLGLQWGDEGKGKAVDILTPEYDIIARFQGGPNAGHSIVIEGNKYVLHQIPSGIFHQDKINLIGNGVVLDPAIFNQELAKLKNDGIETKKSLILSDKAIIITPIHKLLDKINEIQKGDKKIGSTLRGIGPSYQDKYARIALRIGDVLDKKLFDEKYNYLKKQHLAMLALHDMQLDLEEEEQFLENFWKIKENRIECTEYFLNHQLNQNKKILAEGAQGTLLDVDFGSYPYVTSSNTITAGACIGLGIAPRRIGKVFGVLKAYVTRVGGGNFPTEVTGELGEKIRKFGHEIGATTGRKRRCGWLDIPALKYACMLNGVTQLFLMKSDVLTAFKEINVCISYGKQKEFIPNSNIELTPTYQTISGWKSQKKLSLDSQDQKFKDFIKIIETSLQIPVKIISLGPERSQTIIL